MKRSSAARCLVLSDSHDLRGSQNSMRTLDGICVEEFLFTVLPGWILAFDRGGCVIPEQLGKVVNNLPLHLNTNCV